MDNHVFCGMVAAEGLESEQQKEEQESHAVMDSRVPIGYSDINGDEPRHDKGEITPKKKSEKHDRACPQYLPGVGTTRNASTQEPDAERCGEATDKLGARITIVCGDET
jgi:hypothetical protein